MANDNSKSYMSSTVRKVGKTYYEKRNGKYVAVKYTPTGAGPASAKAQSGAARKNRKRSK